MMIKTSKLWFVSFFLVLVIYSCSDSENPTIPEGCTYSEKKAQSFARNLMLENDIDWGSPINMKYVAPRYYFIYETPQDEIPLLGYREIWVDCKTGEAGFTLRD